jgi:hypothetical protein
MSSHRDKLCASANGEQALSALERYFLLSKLEKLAPAAGNGERKRKRQHFYFPEQLELLLRPLFAKAGVEFSVERLRDISRSQKDSSKPGSDALTSVYNREPSLNDIDDVYQPPPKPVTSTPEASTGQSSHMQTGSATKKAAVVNLNGADGRATAKSSSLRSPIDGKGKHPAMVAAAKKSSSIDDDSLNHRGGYRKNSRDLGVNDVLAVGNGRCSPVSSSPGSSVAEKRVGQTYPQNHEDSSNTSLEFLQYLSENLVKPDRSLIDALTNVAADTVGNPLPIISALLVHISTARGSSLLAAWCLIDSIVTTVGMPFTAHFSQVLPDLLIRCKVEEAPLAPSFASIIQGWLTRNVFSEHSSLLVRLVEELVMHKTSS